MTTQNICYDLNLLYLDFRISQKLDISNEIFITIINILKNIQKIAVTREQMRKNNKLDNHFDFGYAYLLNCSFGSISNLPLLGPKFKRELPVFKNFTSNIFFVDLHNNNKM